MSRGEEPLHHHLPKMEDDDEDDDEHEHDHDHNHGNIPTYPYPYPPDQYQPPRNTPPPTTANHPRHTPSPHHQRRSRTPTPPPPQMVAPPSPPQPSTPRKHRPPPPPAVFAPPPPAPHKVRAPPPAYTNDDYDDYDDGDTDKRSRVAAVIVTILVILGIIALIVWLVYRPHKPSYTAVAAAVYSLNVTALPSSVSASVQLTVLTRNPNKRTPLYYDGLTATMFYRNQPITPPLKLPPLAHKKRSTVMMSPVIGGAVVPIPGDVADGVARDEAYGTVGLSWVLTGRIRYKAGWFWSGRSRVYVRCDIVVGLRSATAGVFNNPAGQVPLLGTPPCLVDM